MIILFPHKRRFQVIQLKFKHGTTGVHLPSFAGTDASCGGLYYERRTSVSAVEKRKASESGGY